MDFPSRISLAQLPTPLQPLRRLQAQSGGPLIWLKRDDMTGSTLSGNKVRKLEFILARAIDENCDTIITCGGIQSNHCRATAIAAAQLGLDCHLILRGLPDENQAPEGNLLLDELAGATVSFYRPAEFFQSLDNIFSQLVADYQAEGKKALAVPTGGSNGVGAWGYLAAFNEIKNDCLQQGIAANVIVTATGSGGTQAGLTLGAASDNNQTTVYGINVCDNEEWFINKINQDIADWRKMYPEQAQAISVEPVIRVIDGYVGRGYAKADENVFATIKRLASLEGIVLDPVYTGKAFDGLLTEIAAGRFADQSDIVFVHTGGIFGLFPYASGLSS